MSTDTKKFIGFVVAMTILLFSIDFMGYKLVTHFFKKMKNGTEYNIEMAMNEVKADLIFIGASQCVGNYDTKLFEKNLQLQAFNAGMGGQRMDYQIIAANAIIKRKVPKYLIWDFDPNLLAKDDGVFLKLDLNTYYDSHEDVKNTLKSVDEFVYLKQLFYSYRYNSKLMQILYANLGKAEEGKGYVPYDCKMKDKIKLLKPNHYPEFGSDSQRKMKLMSDNIKEWKKKGIKIYVLVSPIYRQINYKINGIETAEKICKENGVIFKDFSQLKDVYSNPEYFRDQIHLCKTGSELYSNHVTELIKN
jgi:hypothetical protein